MSLVLSRFRRALSTHGNTVTLKTRLTFDGAPTATASNTGGNIAVGTYYYKITCLDADSVEATPSSCTKVTTTGNTSSVALSWSDVADSFKVYRDSTPAFDSANCFIASAANASYTDTAASTTAGNPTATDYGHDVITWTESSIKVFGPYDVDTEEIVVSEGFTVDDYKRVTVAGDQTITTNDRIVYADIEFEILEGYPFPRQYKGTTFLKRVLIRRVKT